MTSEQYSVSWDDFLKHMSSGIKSLLENEDFVDVTLAVEGRYLKAHKMVLSVCSPYFRDLFKSNPCEHPIVFMKDVSYTTISHLLQFIYQGEVQVSQENFTSFMQTAESLQIRGLSNNALRRVSSKCNQEVKTAEKFHYNSSPKRRRLTESPQCDFVKTESIENAAANDFSVQVKSEPLENEQSAGKDFSNDGNENFWMMESGDEPRAATTDGLLAGEESLPSDIEEVAESPMLPEKSKDKYEYTFNRFEQWCNENDVKTITEDVLMAYFKEKSTSYKSSSLWGIYSMLRTTISIRKHLDISSYRNLITFLKNQSIGYQAKRSEVFKKEDFVKFLEEADNDTYLMMKVAMIIGVVGACSNAELTNLLRENVTDEGGFIRISIPDSKSKTSREFVLTAGNIEHVNLAEIIRKYMRLRPDHHRFFLAYRNGKCVKQPVGVNTFGAIPKMVAKFLGLKNPERFTGHCFKRMTATFKLAPLVHL